MLSYILSNDSITVYVNGRPGSVARGTPNFELLKEALIKYRNGEVDEAAVERLLDIENVVETYSCGDVRVNSDGTATYKGAPLPPVLAQRLLDCASENIPYEFLVRFIERLSRNPSKRAIEELYTFLEHKNLPITQNGTFLAYKAVRNDYRDKYSGVYLNTIGATLTMPRNKVCDDADRGCSAGFHAGSIEYVRGFAYGYGTEEGDRIVIVEIDPADVVSIPKDCAFQKLRTCKYYVVCEYTGLLPKTAVDAASPYNSLGRVVDLDEGDEAQPLYTQAEFDAEVESTLEEERARIREEEREAIRAEIDEFKQRLEDLIG